MLTPEQKLKKAVELDYQIAKLCEERNQLQREAKESIQKDLVDPSG